MVIAHRSSVDGPLTRTESRSAAADQAGRFTIDGLTGGPYILCVNAYSSALLDPCAWGDAPPLVRVAPGQTSSEIEITVQEGTMLKVRLEDPNRLVRTPMRSQATADLLIGVWTKEGFFHPARLRSSDSKGHNYEIVVPNERDLKLSLNGQRLALFDDRGAAFDRTAAVPLRMRLGQAPPALRFTVRPPQN
jgi:hypothetical protein